ncbi:class I SAM-dependent DNA methyltransferase [Pseudomonas aeruginosa]|uniref:class I SAM-dependent DNA methyltransferase n=1 Tax=Pseudomonas aeruginosa TaxID=287 RepID=UPI0029356636|nr:DNA methyltransferase [Pseudomonas aeruginosa]MDV2792976.1 DNA methyltransferase [Pseudomonas aeruginosa]
MNAVEIEAAISELALQPFDAAEFPFAFLAAFGNKDTALKRLRAGNNNTSDVPGGVLLRNNIHIAVCEAGTVGETLQALRASPATAKAKAKFILATDGQALEAEELVSGETIACDYSDFPNHFGFLLPLAGISTIKEIKDNPIDVRATGRLNKLYVELLRENPDWAKDERRADMNHFMARLIFCFFAEDTDIFNGEGLFTRTVDRFSDRDGSNTHEVLQAIFRAMNTKIAERAAGGFRPWADQFPYVNGGLFSGSTEVPRFTRMARTYLLHAGGLNWKEINPDIFGSMIQAVADDEERGALGMHYTSVPNILKVLNPLFLDDLRAQLAEAGSNERKLLNLRKRMVRIRVFDPACGSGNFLVIAYKQMREIEAEINRRRGEPHLGSDIPLTNFRGIELRDFPAEIARLALIIAEFQCDVLYRGQKEALAEFLPLNAENWIVCGNALRLDWLSVCPPTGTGVKVKADDLFGTPLNQTEIDFENEGGETYICGNPPYLGAKKKSKQQSEDMSAVGLGDAQLLDYVAAFIVKGLDVVESTSTAMALVSTSSICQGEQVSLLWPRIFSKAAVSFAYRPFKWANSAAKNAGVFCTIIGLVKDETKYKRIYDGEIVRRCESISPYLIPGPKVYCEPEASPISAVSQMKMGSNSVDGKRLVLESDAASAIVSKYPDAASFIRMYGGTKELVSGVPRRCIWIEDDKVDDANNIPPIKAAIDACREYRMSAGRDARKAASRPHAFCYSTYEERDFLQVGNTIGGALAFVPVDIKRQGFVSNHNAFVIYGAPLVEFSIIASTLHKVWAETIAGRLGDGIRYGNTVVYNTFPVPLLTEQNKVDLTACAEDILLAREAHFPATIADLYDPETMPENLRRAHERNDEVLERIYIGRRFKNDTERLEKLFELYTKMTAATATAKPATKATRRKKA